MGAPGGFMTHMPQEAQSGVDPNAAKNVAHGASSGFGIGQKIEHAADSLHLLDNKTGTAVKGFFENPLMKAGAGGLGAVLGGVGMIDAVGEITGGKDDYAKRQGWMNLGSSAIGTAGSAAGALGALTGAGMLGGTTGALGGALAAAGPALGVLGPVGVAAGLAALGNGYTRDHDWFGKDAAGNNRDGFEFAMDNASAANNWAHSVAGNGLAGNVLGGVAGGAAGIGSGAVALGADVVGGAASLTETIGNGIGGLFGNQQAGTGIVNGVGNAVGTAASFAGNVAGGAVNMASNVVGGIGNAASSAVSGIGNAIGSLHLW